MRTSREILKSRPAGKRVAQAAVLSLLAIGAVGFTATAPATAGGKSTTVGNCFTEWWNTAWAQKCPNGAKWTGTYVSGVSCNNQPDGYMPVVRLQGDKSVVSGGDCAFGADDGWITYY